MAALPLRRGGSRAASRARGGSQRSGSAGEGQPAGVQQTPALSDAIMVVPAASKGTPIDARSPPDSILGQAMPVALYALPGSWGREYASARSGAFSSVLTQSINVLGVRRTPFLPIPKSSGCILMAGPTSADEATSRNHTAPDIREAAPHLC